MQIELITSCDELESLASAWNELAGDALFAGPDWLIPWWRHLGSRPTSAGRTPRLTTLAVRDDAGQLVAIAPWFLEETRLHGRILRLLGSGRACTDFLTIPCQPTRETEVATAIATWLLENERRADFGWDLLALEAIDPTDAMYSRLLEILGQYGAISSARPAGNCWRVPLAGSWEDYVATLSKTNRKRARRLDRSYLQTGRARMISTTTAAELPDAFNLLVELHTKRWQSRGEGGIFAEPGVLEFHREATARLLAAGELRLAALEIDGRPVASEYCMQRGRTRYSYQSGLDPEMITHEPGAILVVATIQEMLAEGSTGLDFLRGDEPYKLDWRAVKRPVYDVRVLPGTWNGRLRQSLWQAATSAKDLLRAGRDAVLSAK